MKKIFLIVLLITVNSLAWSQKTIQKIEYYDYWKTKIKKKYSIDQTTQSKNGKYLLYDQQGNCVLDLNYKNDELNGIQKIYFEADEEDDVQSFFGVKYIEDGLEQGSNVKNYCGSPTIIVNYINGKKDGWKKVYVCKPSYQLKKEVLYKDGETVQSKYYNIFVRSEDVSAQQVRYLSTFSDSYSIEDIDYQLKYWASGEICQYYKNGKLAMKKSGSDLSVYNKYGKLIEINGESLFYKNGQIKQSGDTTFYASGRIKSIGQNLFYYENGSLERHGDTTFYQSGKIETLGDDIIFYETGIKKQSGDTTFFQSGKIETIGSDIVFYETGIKKQSRDTTFYQNGKIATIGKNIVYYENGNLKTDGVNKYFENGKPEYFKDASYERTYYNSGQLLSEKNLTTGEYIENYPNGSLKLKTCYNKEGRLNGYYQKYDEKGSLTEFTLYAAGEKQAVNMDIVYKAFRDFFGTTKKSDYISIGDAPMEYYSPNSPTKLIYSKGEKLMGSYKEGYANETLNEKRNIILKNAVNALIGLKALADKNTEQMQEDLKQAKTVEDIEGFLYYYDTIKVQSGNITQKYLTLQSDKSKFSTIGKDQYKVISSEYKEYIKMFYCKTKFDKGSALLEKLDKAVK